MSRFSDKSDFADTCLMHYSPNKIFYDADVYINDVLFKAKSPNDFIPYYGHIIASMSSNNDHISINLSRKSQPDSRDYDVFSIFLNDFVKICRKFRKTNKTDPVPFELFEYPTDEKDRKIIYEAAIKNEKEIMKYWTQYLYRPSSDEFVKYEINNVLIKNIFENITTSSSNYYREQLLEYAAETFGKIYTQYDSDKFFDEINKCDYIYNKELMNIHNKVCWYRHRRDAL